MGKTKKPRELASSKLRCAGAKLLPKFATTADVRPLKDGIIGQERAVRAMEFGLRVKRPGYNIFVVGQSGSGRTTYARVAAEAVARTEAIPTDWVYKYNFNDSEQPIAVQLPAGRGQELRHDLEELLNQLRQEITQVLTGRAFEEQSSQISRRFQQESTQLLGELEHRATEVGFSIKRGQSGFATIPLKDGEPISQEDYSQLPEEERERYDQIGQELQVQIGETLHRLRQVEQKVREEYHQLEQETVTAVIQPLINGLRERYQDVEGVLQHLDLVQQEIMDNVDDYKAAGEQDDEQRNWFMRLMEEPAAHHYQVNLLVNHANTQGAPVVVETNPTYYNLFGSVEYRSQMGMLATDFMQIKPGALHLANGGYLIVQANDVLLGFLAWDTLKRALKTKEIRIENIGEQYRMLPTTTLKPEIIPLRLKVIMIGSSLLYHLLYHYDEDFRKLFKIKADFDTAMDYNREHVAKYVAFISSLCQREGLRPLDRGAVARVIEYSLRLVNSQRKLSTRFNEVAELLYEAEAWASVEGQDVVTAGHVDRASKEKIQRSNRIETQIQEMLLEGKLMISTKSERVGQVNGLAVYSLGDYSFAKPTRITAKTFMGQRGIVNIEREIQMSGSIHSKGIMTLSGYLGGQYGTDKPLALSASLGFEQVYEEIDGDSAASAELYAILSSLADLPLKQELAVTGSVNQHGEIQPIGGVNEKIEGFFALCQAQGLTGQQGVIIPHQNTDELMLSGEVVQAVAAGQFHIYPVQHIDEGLLLLTGHPSGTRRDNGTFTRASVHYRVNRRLEEMARGLIKFGREGGKRK